MIPKPSGGMRKLGVPAAVDRLICQAIAQVLTPVFDPHLGFTTKLVEGFAVWRRTLVRDR
jgi:retron-type reverse transcriptase